MRRGSILLIIRMGNIDLEAPNTPAMEAPNPYMQPMAPPHGVMPHPMKAPANMRMAPQGPTISSSPARPGVLPPTPTEIAPTPLGNSGPPAAALPPTLDTAPPVNLDPQSAAPAPPPTSQDPTNASGFGRRPLSLRRRVLSGSGPDSQ
jgi:hypothetical protein